MWEISKEFNFSAGHRVWSQQLNSEYSLDDNCVCRHLHGHEYKINVTLSGDELTRGMLTDFKHLNWFKKFLDDTIDHKFIIDKNDPIFDTIIPDFKAFNHDNYIFEKYYWKINPQKYILYIDHLKELYESYVVVDFIPTSENLSKWLFDIVKEAMSKIDVKVSKLELWETPKSKSVYYE